LVAALTVVVAAVAAISIGIYVHWRDSPNLFGPAGDGAGADAVAVGHTDVFAPGIQTTADRTVDLREVTPQIGSNTAQATVTVVLCEKRPGAYNLGGGGLSDLRAECASITAFHAGTYRLQFNSTTQLFAEITPHHAGTIQINGFRVRYNDGARRGNQVTGLDVTVTSP
jgi:hypothetical protein